MSTRPRRAIKPPPLTYWEEFVETDTWYTKKIFEDVPEDEWHAALYDEDFAVGEDTLSGDESEADDDSGSEVDMDYILVEQTDIAIPEEYVAISDAESGSDARTDSDSDSDDADTDPRDTEEEEVLGSSEGE